MAEKKMTKGDTIIPRFYINPFTSRVIKSTGRKYNQLRKEKHTIEKHKCLYNVKTAEKCLKKLLTLYPNVYPSSNFIEIPKTYRKGTIRAFICKKSKKSSPKKKSNKKNKKGNKKSSPNKKGNNIKKTIIAFVDKNGEKHRLQKPIVTNKDIPVVQDYTGTLNKLVKKLDKISISTQKMVETQIEANTPMQNTFNINVLYNPLQNDFVPIREHLHRHEHQVILNIINENLIPTNLPPIARDLDIAGFLIGDGELVGYIDTNNKISRFQIPVKINQQNKDVIKTLPEVVVTDPEHIKSLYINTVQSKMIPEIQKKEILEKLDILNGEQLEPLQSRPLPCNMYFLVWDPDFKMCKISTKEPIIEEITEPQPEVTEPQPEITESQPEVTVTEPEVTELEPELPITIETKKLIVQNPYEDILGYMDVSDIQRG